MKTKYFLGMLFGCLGIILPITSSAQSSVVMNGDTMIVNNQAKFWLNQIIYFGYGTMPDKTYSYIYESPNPLQKLISDHRKRLLGAGFKGYKCKVVKFEKEIGRNKKDEKYTILVIELPDGKRYWSDIANAYSSNEIVINEPENKTEGITKAADSSRPDQTIKKTTTTKKASKTAPVNVF